LQTVQQNVGFDQTLKLKLIGDSIKFSRNTTASSHLVVLGITNLYDTTLIKSTATISGVTTLNTTISIDGSFNVYGLIIALNNVTTCKSSLYVPGITILANNVGMGSTTTNNINC
jgi:hypothetical protein